MRVVTVRSERGGPHHPGGKAGHRPALAAASRLGGLLALTSLFAGSASAQNYSLDSANTRVTLEVRHIGVRWMQAVIHQLAGGFVIDSSGKLAGLEVRMASSSIDCGDDSWSTRLRSARWFNAARFPELRFRSTRVAGTPADDSHLVANGELTVRDTTRPVMLNFDDVHCARTAAGAGPCSFSAHAHIKRSDFSLPHGLFEGGDGVDIAVQGVARPDAGTPTQTSDAAP